MTTNTQAATLATYAAALALVNAGRVAYDAMPPAAQKAQRGVWRAELMARTGISRQAAHRHIDRALAREGPPRWGQASERYGRTTA